MPNSNGNSRGSRVPNLAKVRCYFRPNLYAECDVRMLTEHASSGQPVAVSHLMRPETEITSARTREMVGKVYRTEYDGNTRDGQTLRCW